MTIDGPVWRSTQLLTRQYRMHEDIVHWPSTEFYGGRLLSAEGLNARSVPWRVAPSLSSSSSLLLLSPPPPPQLAAVQIAKRVSFIDVDEGVEQARGTSFVNVGEASALLAVLDSLSTAGVCTQRAAAGTASTTTTPASTTATIGIITFYAAQVRLVTQMLASTSHSHVRVATVDSFQVVLSLVIIIFLKKKGE